jgi:hypothetical protein
MKRILIFISLFIFFSCTQTAKEPENLVGEDKMAEILSEIYFYQQSSYLSELKDKKPDYAKIDVHLIEKYGVTVQQFEDSYRYYVLIPEKYNEVLLKVRDKLENQLPENERKKRIEDRKNEEKKK